ncbi:lon protease [Anaeramoeba flamelloides]|uniref:Lon protease homolog n=1 Tax=Anaeramoeba flamelloides TaxID=1746091 RepID=A0ABQ8YD84_9EUKA|nr:lon protease [Anaeramoeba flamelloides]
MFLSFLNQTADFKFSPNNIKSSISFLLTRRIINIQQINRNFTKYNFQPYKIQRNFSKKENSYQETPKFSEKLLTSEFTDHLPILPLIKKPIFPNTVIKISITHKNLSRYFDNLSRQHTKYVGLFLTKEPYVVHPNDMKASKSQIEIFLDSLISQKNQEKEKTKEEEEEEKEKEKDNEKEKVKEEKNNVKQSSEEFVINPNNRGMDGIKSYEQLHHVGVLGRILSSNLTTERGVKTNLVIISALERIRLYNTQMVNTHLEGVTGKHPFSENDYYGDVAIRAYTLNIIETIHQLIARKPAYGRDLNVQFLDTNINSPNELCNLVGVLTSTRRDILQQVLEETDELKRLERTLTLLKGELEINDIQQDIDTQIQLQLENQQRRIILEDQLQFIKRELGMKSDDKKVVIGKLLQIVKKKSKYLPDYTIKAIKEQLTRLETLHISSSEFNNIRNYLDWILNLPWNKYQKENLDLNLAEQILEEDHFGLKDIKKNILEFIAVGNLKKKFSGKILCLVGAPGVGKTSIGKSIARALNREFFRFSLGGLTDVMELKGFKRTYVGALPGIFIQALKKLKTSNPVIVLDEIDKMGMSYKGDPASALLEALDPEQNSEFMDHFLDIPVDLSKVLFVMTANVIDTIPRPLLDRMEILRISGYVEEEKMKIAKHYLIPRAMEETGIKDDQAEITENALRILIKDYCREEGVRNLQKQIEKIFRKVAYRIAKSSYQNEDDKNLKETQKKEGNKKAKKSNFEKIYIKDDNLTDFVGQPLFAKERIFKIPTVGVSIGLAWSHYGGSLLFIESVISENNYPNDTIKEIPSKGNDENDNSEKDNEEQKKKVIIKNSSNMYGSLKITGQLGKVMQESSQIAYSFAKTFLRKIEPSNDFLKVQHIHTHCPEGAIKKDGPSAGVTIVTSLISLALNKPIKADLAMTGEITLTGKILPVGGIKEKILAARRSDIKHLIFPFENQRDWNELENYIKEGLSVHFVKNYQELYPIAFEI